MRYTNIRLKGSVPKIRDSEPQSFHLLCEPPANSLVACICTLQSRPKNSHQTDVVSETVPAPFSVSSRSWSASDRGDEVPSRRWAFASRPGSDASQRGKAVGGGQVGAQWFWGAGRAAGTHWRLPCRNHRCRHMQGRQTSAGAERNSFAAALRFLSLLYRICSQSQAVA